jgi:anionic cell wall polymer biosynthesis LytR-Cps2A-Psr (LCP) family protein
MKRYLSVIFTITISILLFAVVFWRFQVAYSRMLSYEMPIDDVLFDLAERRERLINPDDQVDFGDDKTINVLILGLDSRKGQSNPHCDAIHMFQLNVEDWSMVITSVPRGTYANIPRRLADNQYYLANACAIEGLEFGIAQIERIVGVKADYYVTVGFSQVYGILRTLQLPTTESLQWLRHRQSYAIGDPQRSRNQAVFMKDLLLTQLGRFRSDAFKPFLFILYNMVNTNMEFPVARALFFGYLNSGIDVRPDDIKLLMKPHHEVQDLHLDFENADEQMRALLNRIAPYLSKDDLSGRPLADYQTELIRFLEMEINSREGFLAVYEQRLWLQIEDDELREEWHFKYLEKMVFDLVDIGELEEAERLLTQYLVEKEAIQQWFYFEKGKELLKSVVKW